MKLYSIVVTILLVFVTGYLTIVHSVEKRDSPKEIATFKGVDGKSISYKLTYCNNGDLTFSSVKQKSIRPSITRWDYYGSTEVQSYKWVGENRISIETKDSTINIVLPEFKVKLKN